MLTFFSVIRDSKSKTVQSLHVAFLKLTVCPPGPSGCGKCESCGTGLRPLRPPRKSEQRKMLNQPLFFFFASSDGSRECLNAENMFWTCVSAVGYGKGLWGLGDKPTPNLAPHHSTMISPPGDYYASCP